MMGSNGSSDPRRRTHTGQLIASADTGWACCTRPRHWLALLTEALLVTGVGEVWAQNWRISHAVDVFILQLWTWILQERHDFFAWGTSHPWSLAFRCYFSNCLVCCGVIRCSSLILEFGRKRGSRQCMRRPEGVFTILHLEKSVFIAGRWFSAEMK